jgi:hypothetical protein
MSKGGGGVGKVFSKVAKTVMKVAPIVLAVAAVVFTAGAGLAAMGAISSTSLLGGGLGAAMTGLTGAMGMSGTLAGVVAGGLTQAAYGSVLGGVMSGITGGNVMKGMQMGAVTGAITGGITGGLGGNIDPIGSGLSKMGEAAGPGAATGGDIIAGGGGADVLAGGSEGLGAAADAASPGAFSSATGADAAAAGLSNYGPATQSVQAFEAGGGAALSGAGDAAAAGLSNYGPATSSVQAFEAAGGGAAFQAGPGAAYNSGGGLLGFVNRNPELVGKVGGGLAEGAMRGMAAGDSAEALENAARIRTEGEMQLEASKRAGINANYQNVQGGGLLTQQNMGYLEGQNGTRPTPGQRFDPGSYRGQWVYSQAQGRVVWVPNGQPATA